MSDQPQHPKTKTIISPPTGEVSTETPFIRDLKSLDLGLLLQLDPIPPILIELVTLLAIISADEDWKIYQETGAHPILDVRGKGAP